MSGIQFFDMTQINRLAKTRAWTERKFASLGEFAAYREELQQIDCSSAIAAPFREIKHVDSDNLPKNRHGPHTFQTMVHQPPA